MTRQHDRNRGRTNEKGKKNKGFKAGVIAFGVAAVLYAAIFPLYRISDFLLCGALSLLAGKIVSIMGSGLDLTTHNKQDQKDQPAPPEELPLSGDEAADAVIARGQEMLHQIRAENDAIPDQVLSGQMDELEIPASLAQWQPLGDGVWLCEVDADLLAQIQSLYGGTLYQDDADTPTAQLILMES